MAFWLTQLFLETLGKRELIEGMGEVIKYGLIEDPELWDLLSNLDGSVESIWNIQRVWLEHSLPGQAQDGSWRWVGQWHSFYLNFGHTIGHAIEATAGYGKVMHGEAVAMGNGSGLKAAAQRTSCQLE